jgi:hypothetical protein
VPRGVVEAKARTPIVDDQRNILKAQLFDETFQVFCVIEEPVLDVWLV